MLVKTCAVPVASGDVNHDSGRVEPVQDDALYVSTALSTWTVNTPERFARDVQVNDKAYRRLDPEYYAWLRSRMHMTKLAVLAGQITQYAFDDLRDRFNRIHDWAMAHFGNAALEQAVRALDARDYLPPVAEQWGRHKAPAAAGNPTAHSEAIAMVDAIREQALGLGWSEERLYATGKPLSPLRGLASYLNSDDRIGAVTRESIEIILASNTCQRFYNPDSEQPWVRRSSRKGS
jgi:hypothetical protein